MRQEVRTPPFKEGYAPQGKKLFEWDKDKQMLFMVFNNQVYICKLEQDNNFICIGAKNKNQQRAI